MLTAAFAYTGGWLSPRRLTPTRIVDSLSPAGGPALGFRRNHAIGICFTGTFESNGSGASLSKAELFAPGVYPVTGRFNLGTSDRSTQDSMARVRGLSLRVLLPDGREWRAAMIDVPFFAVSTPDAFYALQRALADKIHPHAMDDFASAHPEFRRFGQWASNAPWTASYAEDRYNSLNSFTFTEADGTQHVVRWSFAPTVVPQLLSAQQIQKRGPAFLNADITERVTHAPQRWAMLVTVADRGDSTADPSKPWPANRRTVFVGTLVAKEIQPEANGACRDINFDPTVLPPGMGVSDDPFPAARSAAYAISYNRRTAEENAYPRNSVPVGAVQP
nr:catalase family peroxidase [Caballeronia sp. GAFFF1]